MVHKKVKNGFTLIELLAVIVVLAIIATIGYFMVGNIINEVKEQVEVINAKTLVRTVSNYITKQDFKGNKITDEKFYIIKDDIQYILSPNGTLTPTTDFDYEGKLCKFCVIKIKPERQIEVLLEGNTQDVKKKYNSDTVEAVRLNNPRGASSLYNELELFKDVYTSNNYLSGTKRFVSDSNVVYEVQDNGLKQKVYSLNNSSGEGKVTIKSHDDYNIKVVLDNGNYLELNDGILIEQESINKEYSRNILDLYEELKLVAERYIGSHNITQEVYFEFSDGSINIKDIYGNNVPDASVVMNKNIAGSGELRINTAKQTSVVIYSGDNDIKNNFGSDKLYTEQLNYSRDNVLLFRNMHRLELLAEKYLNGKNNTSTYFTSQSDWLVFFYIRRLTYNSSLYNTVTGNDSNFITYVNNNASYLKNYFANKKSYTINGDTIDLRHLAASISGNIYNTDWIYNLVYEELEYDVVVSWGGDLHSLMQNSILKTGIKEQYGNYKVATYNLVGKSGTSFAIDDMYADVDNWLLYYNFRENKNLTIEQVFDRFYTGTSSRSYKNRFTKFITIMNSVGSSLGKTNFEGLVKHITDTDKKWDTIGTLQITPTDAQQNEIAEGFIQWIKEKASKE